MLRQLQLFFEIISVIESHFKLRKKNFKKKFSNNNRFNKHDIVHMFVYSFFKMNRKKNHQMLVLWFHNFEQFKKSFEKNKYVIKCAFINQIALFIFQNYVKFHDKLNNEFISIKKIRIRLSKKLKNKTKCFNVKKINKISFRREQNHKIDLIFDVVFKTIKYIDLKKNQMTTIKIYVNDMLTKNFIRSNFSRYAISILIIKKFDENFRICVDYRTLNALTIKNRNCFFFN